MSYKVEFVEPIRIECYNCYSLSPKVIFFKNIAIEIIG